MGRRRGRVWWLERVVEQPASGLGVAEFFRQERLSSPTFFWLVEEARSRAYTDDNQQVAFLSRSPSSCLFFPLELVELPSNAIRIQLGGGTVLELPAERECLRLVLSVLSELETA